MKTIYKYELHTGTCSILLPKEAKILTANKQGESIYLWAEVDGTQQEEYRAFQTIETGVPISSNNIEYIGTVFMDNGLVFHVYEETKK